MATQNRSLQRAVRYALLASAASAAEDIAATGKMRVEDIINQLPQAMAAQGSTTSIRFRKR